MRNVSIICAAIFVIGLGLNFFAEGQSQGRIAEAQAVQREAAEELEQAEADLDERNAKVVAEAVGISADTIAKDRAAIRQVVETACTWSSYDEYNAARQMLIDEYGLSESSGLLADFLGEVETWTTESGREANTIDERNLAMRVEDVDSRLVGDHGVYRDYFTVVTTGDTFKAGTGDATVVFRVRLDVKSNVTEIDAVEGLGSD